jgi:DNA-binding CsgD family transcriptional regulator/PAS domain-containing protein
MTVALPELVAQAYEGACNPDGMQRFIADAVDYFGAEQGAIAIWPIEQPEHVMPFLHSMENSWFTALFEGLADDNSIFGQLARLDQGKIIGTAGNERAANLLPENSGDLHALGGVVHGDVRNRCCIVFFRRDTESEFSASQVETLQLLISYLARAIDLNRGFIRTYADLHTTRLIIDSAPRGIVIIGQKLQITYNNEEAQRIFSQADGLSRNGDAFEVTDEDSRNRYHDFLGSASANGSGETQAARIGIGVPRQTEGAPYQMVIFKLPFKNSQAILDETKTLAVIAISDPTQFDALPQDLLIAFYRLTPAEAQLTELLSRGLSLAESAAELNISINTARTQLRNVFRKVGVNSQATLMQHIAQSLTVNRLSV